MRKDLYLILSILVAFATTISIFIILGTTESFKIAMLRATAVSIIGYLLATYIASHYIDVIRGEEYQRGYKEGLNRGIELLDMRYTSRH